MEKDLGTSAPVPLFGLEVRRQLPARLMLRGLARYVTFSNLGDISKVSVTDLSLGLEHRTFKNVGIGVVYQILDFNLDLERDLVSGEADYRLSGFEFFLRVGFGGK